MAEVSTVSLKQTAREIGFNAVGVCSVDQPLHLDAYERWLARGHHGTMGYMAESRHLRENARSLLPNARRVIAVRLNYRTDASQAPNGPRIAQYARGRDYHRVMRAKLKQLARSMEADLPGSSWRACVDSAPAFEREYAHYAGLGWFGKNTMLIDSREGSWFFLGLLLTDVPFAVDRPAEGDCGSCQACISQCPTGAIVFVDDRWQINANQCISYLTIEHRGAIEPSIASKIGDWTFGCDVCQDVCPFNQPRESQPLRAPSTEEPDFKSVRTWPTLDELGQISSEQWDALTRGSSVRRATYEGLRRNAQINLQNRPRASGTDEAQ